MTTKANSIAIPVGFNPRNPASVAAAAALLPDDGLDTYSLARPAGVNLIGPALIIDQFQVSSGSTVQVVDYDYALSLPAESFSLATGGTVEYEQGVYAPVVVTTITGLAPTVAIGAAVEIPAALLSVAAVAPLAQPSTQVQIPAAVVTIGGLQPAQVGRSSLELLIPAASLTVAAAAPAALADTAVEDPYFQNVSLLLHMDGSDGSTTFTDSSSNGLTVTPQSDAQISTAQSKFGGASGSFDGSGDRLHLPNGAAVLILDADFTVEVWVYPLSSADMMVLSGRTGNQQIFRLNYLGTGNILCYADGTTIVNTAAGIVANTWQHLALSRSGSNARLFVDGQQQGSTNTSWAGSLSIERVAAFFYNGFLNTPAYYFNGYIDDLRITKGVGAARYTSNFTPPTAPFPDA